MTLSWPLQPTPPLGSCNTPDVTFHICNSNSCHFRLCVMIFPPWLGFVFALHLVHVVHYISCHHVHRICFRVRLMHPSISPVVRFAIRHSHMHRRSPSCLFSCAGVKRSRNGPRFAKWPWYTTHRPPVKFHSICRSFDAPTVNRVTAKASCVVQPNTPPNSQITHLSPFHALGRSITIVWAKPHSIWSLLAPSTYKYVHPSSKSGSKP